MHSLFIKSIKLYFIAYLEAFKIRKREVTKFNLSRLIFLTLLFPAFIFLQILHSLCYFIDDILFKSYKTYDCSNILFIIGIPRSGTTYIHRTLSKAQGTTTFSTAESIFAPTITEKKCLELFSKFDNFIGSPILKIINFIINQFGNNFHNIHSVSIDAPEEDYLSLLPIGYCFILLFAFPKSKSLRRLIDFKHIPKEERNAVLKFYKRNIQRHLYQKDNNLLFISKNASFCTWLDDLEKLFPKAKFILSTREPTTAIASQINALEPARLVFGSDPKGIITESIVLQAYAQYYSEMLCFYKKVNPNKRALIEQEYLRKDPILILENTIKSLKIPIDIKRINFSKNKELNTTIRLERFPEIKIYNAILEDYHSLIKLALRKK